MKNRDWLTARARATPNATALIINEQRWTYAQLENIVQRYCHHLNWYGIQAGDKVAVLLPNCLAYVGLVHALARMGAVLAPLNIRLTAPEIQWQLNLTQAAWLLYDDETAQQALAQQALAAQNGCQLLHVASLDEKLPKSSNYRPHSFSLDHLQSIVFTSGTTGRPKGAMLTFANHFWSATASAYRLGLQTNDSWLSCLPLYHVGGLAVVFRSCLYGTAIVLHQGFDLDTFTYSLKTQPVTLTSLVPTMLHRLLQVDEGAMRQSEHLRMILLGGAATTPELIATMS